MSEAIPAAKVDAVAKAIQDASVGSPYWVAVARAAIAAADAWEVEKRQQHSKQMARARYHRLRAKRGIKRDGYRAWSEADMEILRAWYPLGGWRRVQIELAEHRTERAIRRAAQKAGLRVIEKRPGRASASVRMKEYWRARGVGRLVPITADDIEDILYPRA